jgi:hypothetical protein
MIAPSQPTPCDLLAQITRSRQRRAAREVKRPVTPRVISTAGYDRPPTMPRSVLVYTKGPAVVTDLAGYLRVLLAGEAA